jgi:hypothetical protein
MDLKLLRYGDAVKSRMCSTCSIPPDDDDDESPGSVMECHNHHSMKLLFYG